ncbi:MAG: hypothetical protein Q4C61_11395 [Lachnospiraceae bacterium]|nr:hypothetical protein [Lachnospiraceae bacterium]
MSKEGCLKKYRAIMMARLETGKSGILNAARVLLKEVAADCCKESSLGSYVKNKTKSCVSLRSLALARISLNQRSLQKSIEELSKNLSKYLKREEGRLYLYLYSKWAAEQAYVCTAMSVELKNEKPYSCDALRKKADMKKNLFSQVQRYANPGISEKECEATGFITHLKKRDERPGLLKCVQNILRCVSWNVGIAVGKLWDGFREISGQSESEWDKHNENRIYGGATIMNVEAV